MTKLQYGTLLFQDNTWHFRHGCKESNPQQELPDFAAQLPHLLSSFQLFKGHQKIHKLLYLRQSLIVARGIARHISAAGLSSEDLPSLTQFKNLNPNDRKIWTDSYKEEYFGLIDLPCWKVISEAEYRAIKHLCPYLLPSMAISTIKYDENGNKQ